MSYPYGQQYKLLSPMQIKQFAESYWEQHINVSSTHPDIMTFIQRNKRQIVEELASDTQEFQTSVLKLWNSYNSYNSSTQVFNLKLSTIGGDFKDHFSSQFVVHYNPKIANHQRKTTNLNNKSKEATTTFLCQCIFKQSNCDILKIITDNRYRLQCKYLNDDTKKEYAVVKITNAFEIFTSDSDLIKKQYVAHINQCEWVRASDFALFLYKIQIQNAQTFVSNIMSNNNKNICEIKDNNNNSIDMHSDLNTKTGIKRTWNESNEIPNDDQNEEPQCKKIKITDNTVITDDDYHIKQDTNGNPSDNNNNNYQNEGQKYIDEHFPAFNWEADIERDFCYTQSNDTLQLQLTPIQSIILYKSAEKCKSSLQSNPEQYASQKQNILQLIKQPNDKMFEWTQPNLSQSDAICKSVLNPLSLIHGPPGTGKTSTCAHLVNAIILTHNLLMTKKKMFVCAYTHNAINELLTKMCTYYTLPDRAILRLGDKDKCPKKLKKFCLEQRLKAYPTKTESEKTAAIEHILSETLVVVGTVYSVNSRDLASFLDKNDYKVFNWLLVDECSQIMDPVLNIAVNILEQSAASRLILVGDHKQLPPVIKSKSIQQRGYKTVFETLVEQIKTDRNHCQYYSLLNVQYRMAQSLIHFSNQEWYDNKIESYQKEVDFNDAKLLCLQDKILNKINESNAVTMYCNKGIPIYVVKLANINNGNAIPKKSEGGSWKNEGEARFICRHILEALDADISTGIISFYKTQATYIDNLLYTSGIKKKLNGIMSATVDSFQGKEKDLIILSLVRNVVKHGNKFNNDAKRINVALTRCKKALIVVTSFDFKHCGNNNCSGKNDIWKRWFRDFDQSNDDNEEKIDVKQMRNVYAENDNGRQLNKFNQINMNRIYGGTQRENTQNRINVGGVEHNYQRDEVWNFLSEILLTEYFDIFIANGFDDMETVLDMTHSDLQKIGVVKFGHQKKIIKAAKKEMGVII